MPAQLKHAMGTPQIRHGPVVSAEHVGQAVVDRACLLSVLPHVPRAADWRMHGPPQEEFPELSQFFELVRKHAALSFSLRLRCKGHHLPQLQACRGRCGCHVVNDCFLRSTVVRERWTWE